MRLLLKSWLNPFISSKVWYFSIRKKYFFSIYPTMASTTASNLFLTFLLLARSPQLNAVPCILDKKWKMIVTLFEYLSKIHYFSKLQGCSSKIELATPFSMLNFFSLLARSSVLLHAFWRFQKMILISFEDL